MGRKILRSVLPAILLIVLIVIMNSYVRNMTYPAPSFRVPESAPKPFQDVWLSGNSGSKIHAWYFASADPDAPIVVYFHGNGENLETMRLSGLFDALIALNVSVLAIDYPGYGRSERKASEQNISAASSAAVQWAKEKHRNSKLFACGWSLGAAVAIDVASRHPDSVDGLIAMSPWSSLQDVARIHFPAWMVRFMLQESYDSLTTASKVQCPSLFIHGVEDTLIPAEQGKRVAAAVPVKTKLVLLPDVSHNDLLNSQHTWTEIRSFLDTVTNTK